MIISIQLGSECRRVTVPSPALLTDVAGLAGIILNTRCAGQGACGGCAVSLGSGRYRVEGREADVKPGDSLSALACQTTVLSATASVSFPPASMLEKSAVIDEDFFLEPFEAASSIRQFEIDGIPEPKDLALTLEDGFLKSVRALCKEPIAPLPFPVLGQLTSLTELEVQKITVTCFRADGIFHVLDLAPAGSSGDVLGVAIDIGTTTVVAMLVDLLQARILSKASMYNQQIQKADDVASRISACRSDADVVELQRLVIQDTLNPLLSEICEKANRRSSARIYEITLSANTVMSHLFLGISPVSIGRFPFRPVQTRYPEQEAVRLGLNCAPHARVRIVSSISGYVGGDITSDIYVTGMHKPGETRLLIDIGTNGEIVLRAGDRITACATAAGPAFEGYGLHHGCRASIGAIEHIDFGATLEMKHRVIGDQPPVGFCGSAMIDFIACGFRSGLINSVGRLDVHRLKQTGRYLRSPALTDDSIACILVMEKDSGISSPLFISEREIARLLNAKAAIYAGLTTLLEVSGLRALDLHRIDLAGGFARHINLQNAITMGLLPEIPLARYSIIGNGSLAGAYLTLVDARSWMAYEEIVPQLRVIELNQISTFESHYIDALGLPNLDVEAFPDVLQLLRNPPS